MSHSRKSSPPGQCPFASAARAGTFRLITAGVLIVLGIALFQFHGNAVRGYIDTPSLFVWWFSQWFNHLAQAGHGPFILAVSLGLLGWNLRASHRSETAPDNPRREGTGLLLIALGFLLHLAGLTLQQTRFSIPGFLLFLNGAAYLLGGRRWGDASRLPCAFMLFSMPLGFLFDEFGFHLRLSVIETATHLANLLGLDVIRNGTQLSSPDGAYHYDVAPACSGLRSLTALTALSTLLGCLLFRSAWRRLLFMLLALPFAWLGNVARILAIMIAAHFFGQDAGAVVHEWFGFLIFLIVLGLALATASLLQKYLPEKPVPASPSYSDDTPPLKLGISPALACFLLVLLGTTTLLASRNILQPQPPGGTALILNLAGDPVTPPSLLALEWSGQNTPISAVERDILPPDTTFSRMLYRSLDNPRQAVLLSAILSGGDRSSIHRPEICLVGQGWSITGRFSHTFTVPGIPEGIPATVLRTRRSAGDSGEDIPGLFAYFFVGENIIASTNHERMLQAIRDRIFKRQNHRWAYLFLQTELFDDDDLALARLQSVLELSTPHLLDTTRLDK